MEESKVASLYHQCQKQILKNLLEKVDVTEFVTKGEHYEAIVQIVEAFLKPIIDQILKYDHFGVRKRSRRIAKHAVKFHHNVLALLIVYRPFFQEVFSIKPSENVKKSFSEDEQLQDSIRKLCIRGENELQKEAYRNKASNYVTIMEKFCMSIRRQRAVDLPTMSENSHDVK
jgi:hypothetical protein